MGIGLSTKVLSTPPTLAETERTSESEVAGARREPTPEEIPAASSGAREWRDDAELLAATLREDHTLRGRHYGKVVQVHDGDTCRVVIRESRSGTLQQWSVRLLGLDAFETRCSTNVADRDVRKGAGVAGRLALENLALGRVVSVDVHDWDKYGGRVLGSLRVVGDAATGAACEEIDASEHILSLGLAVPYGGEKKRDFDQMCGVVRARVGDARFAEMREEWRELGRCPKSARGSSVDPNAS